MYFTSTLYLADDGLLADRWRITDDLADLVLGLSYASPELSGTAET